jgi:hypothetical protein
MQEQPFEARIRFWDETKSSGLAVADVPAEVAQALGGLKQQRVRGRINDAEFTSNVMPAGGGRLALSVSKAMMKSVSLAVGDHAAFLITGTGTGPS